MTSFRETPIRPKSPPRTVPTFKPQWKNQGKLTRYSTNVSLRSVSSVASGIDPPFSLWNVRMDLHNQHMVPFEQFVSVGRNSRAVTPRGLQVETRFVLCEADVPITSHDINLRPNPAFPACIQHRDRGKVSTEDDLNEKIARFEPAYLGESISAGDGAPIVGPDYVVESGNGRIILLRRLYRDHLRKAAEYRGWLLLNAPSFGIARDHVDALTRPVLVRVRSTLLSPEERIAFAEDANTDPKLKLSPVEVARSDANRLTAGLLNQLYVDDDGEILSAANRPFIAAFLDEVVGPARGDLITSDGQLSQSGVLRIKAAIFAKAYGDTDAGLQALEKLSESTDVNIKRLINAMLRYASRFAWLKEAIAAGAAYPLDLAPDLAEVARQLSLLREQGRTVEEHLQQMGLFGETMSRVQKKLLFVFNQYRNSAKAMGGILGKCLDAIDTLGDPKQEAFFVQTIPTKEELLERAVQLYENGEGEQGGLFGEVPVPGIGGDKEVLFTERAAIPEVSEVSAEPNPEPEIEEKSFKVLMDGGSNAQRFATREEADSAARELRSRWTAMDKYTIEPSDDPVNYRWDDAVYRAVRTEAITPEPTPVQAPETKPKRRGGRPKSNLDLKTRRRMRNTNRRITTNRESMTKLVTALASKSITQGDSKMENQITLTFSHEKDTKNTRKYEEDERVGQPKLVGSLYLAKHVAAGIDKLTVTIS